MSVPALAEVGRQRRRVVLLDRGRPLAAAAGLEAAQLEPGAAEVVELAGILDPQSRLGLAARRGVALLRRGVPGGAQPLAQPQLLVEQAMEVAVERGLVGALEHH